MQIVTRFGVCRLRSCDKSHMFRSMDANCNTKPAKTSTGETALDLLTSAGRPVTMKEFARHGVSRMALKRLVDAGKIERSVRGVYRLPWTGEEDARTLWASITRARPDAVFCMVSAAAYHGLTQNMAGVLNIAVSGQKHVPGRNSMGVAAQYVQWKEGKAFTEGVDKVLIDGIEVAITNPERTIVDLFRYSTFVPQRREPNIYIDPETFHDALIRYLHGGGDGTSGKLRRMAKSFGVWDRLDPIVKAVNLTYEKAPGF